MADQNQNSQQNQQQNSPAELVRGVVGFFSTVKGSKVKIVYTNVFTGKIKVKSGGLFFNFPWRTSPVEISLEQHKIDTVCRKTTTRIGNDVGPEVDYDTDYFIKVVDPSKFMDSSYSQSVEQVRKNIGEILDQKIQDYIRSSEYDTLIHQPSIDFLDQIGKRTSTGAFPTGSLNQFLLEQYGIGVAHVTFKIRLSKEIQDAINARKQASEQAKAEDEKRKVKVTAAKADAEVKKIQAETDANVARLMGEASGAALRSELEAYKGIIPDEQMGSVVQAREIAKSKGTIIHSVGGSTATTDALTTGMMMGRGFAMQNTEQPVQQQQPQQQPPAQQQPQQQAPSQVDWSAVSDDEYLTAEDSAQLAAERKTTILPGGRYHISYLTEEEKKRYCVASAKGKTK